MSATALLPLAMIVAGRYGGAARRPARYGFAICCGGYFLFFTLFADSPYVEVLATSKAIERRLQAPVSEIIRQSDAKFDRIG